MDINFLLLLLNGVVTCLCGLIILYNLLSKHFEKHAFYPAWACGFLIYGTQIIMRAYALPAFLLGTLALLSSILFIAGMWSLGRPKFLFYVLCVTCLLMALLGIGALLNMFSAEQSFAIASSISFIPITLGVIYQRIAFGKNADKFALGWLLLLLSNVLLLNTEWIDVFAIFSKGVILLGVMDYDFIIVIEKVRNGLNARLPSIDAGGTREGGLKLMIDSQLSHELTAERVYKIAQANAASDIRTYVFSFQDVLPYRLLRKIKWVEPEKISILVFSESAERANEEFTILPMSITHIGATISEVTKKHLKLQSGGCVVFLDLSLLINFFGAYPVYTMLLNKMGSIREAGVELFAFFYPDTHSDKSVVYLFKSLADEIIKL